MDPEAALTKIRELVEAILGREEDLDIYADGTINAEGLDLAETFQGLDEWLKNGGFLPADWRR